MARSDRPLAVGRLPPASCDAHAGGNQADCASDPLLRDNPTVYGRGSYGTSFGCGVGGLHRRLVDRGAEAGGGADVEIAGLQGSATRKSTRTLTISHTMK